MLDLLKNLKPRTRSQVSQDMAIADKLIIGGKVAVVVIGVLLIAATILRLGGNSPDTVTFEPQDERLIATAIGSWDLQSAHLAQREGQWWLVTYHRHYWMYPAWHGPIRAYYKEVVVRFTDHKDIPPVSETTFLVPQ
jgi:hypothetical protein